MLLGPRKRLDGGLEVVDLDGDVAEASADIHRAVGWPIEGIELVAGELEHGQAGPTRLTVRADHVASLIRPIPGKPPRAAGMPAGSQPYHAFPVSDGSRRSRKDTKPVDSVFQRTAQSLPDTGGHATDTVRDREAPGSNPGPRPHF